MRQLPASGSIEQTHVAWETVMRRGYYGLSLLFMVLLCAPAGGQNTRPAPDQRYTVAFASVAPLNTDIFVAAGDGSGATPLLAHPELDYNASFSPDGRSIVFTSTRNGTADIYRVGIDGASLQRLTDDGVRRSRYPFAGRQIAGFRVEPK